MSSRLPLLAFSLSVWGVPSASAQASQCTHSVVTEEIGEATERWVFDGAGRIRRLSEDNYFYGREEAYRYDRRGRLSHTQLVAYVGGGVEDFESPGPVPVQRSTEGGQVTQERQNVSWTDRRTVRFDARGRPARVEIGRGDDDRTTTHECSYDLAGRPIHMRTLRRNDGRVELDLATHWQWRDGRLARVVRETNGEDRIFEVHLRGNTVHLVSLTETQRERWTGACAPVFFDACSPALNPAPERGRRARLPTLRSRRVRPRVARTQPPLVGPALRRGRLTLARLRAAYPGYRVWTDVTFAESSPGIAIPVVCVGSGDACTTRIHYDERQRWTRVTTRDPMFSAGGVRVGDLGVNLEGDLEDCRMRGDIGYVECSVQDAARTTVLLAVPESLELSGDEAVGPNVVADLRVAAIEETRPRRLAADRDSGGG